MTFGTYLGGSGDEAGLGIALDAPLSFKEDGRRPELGREAATRTTLSASGSVYVMGVTTSGDLDTVHPFQGANAGNFDVFIARIGELQLQPWP